MQYKTQNIIWKKCLCLLLAAIIIMACSDNEKVSTVSNISPSKDSLGLIHVMEKHLNSVSDRDLETLRSTMSPSGNMQLILPGTEIIHSVNAFMEYHEEWFQDTSWSFETKILNTTVGEKVGMAITEVIYREPERDGKPYFNRMIVSYDLVKENGNWYVIKDHASSIEKSTDQD